MSSEGTERRLAAIMFTDIVGYTALMAESEEKGLRAKQQHRELVRPLVENYHGEWIESPGDQTLSTFPTALDAVNCALAIQERLENDPELKLHLGIHLGDLVVQGEEVSGDGVNIASRICALSDGGGLCVSGEVHRSIRNQPGIEATPLGEQMLKNVPESVAVYAVAGAPAPPRAVADRPEVGRRRVAAWAAGAAVVAASLVVGAWLAIDTPEGVEPELDPGAGVPTGSASIAVLPFTNMSGDPEQEYFSDGLTEDIITGLSQFGDLLVMARNSTFRYKDKAVDIKQVGRDLGVRYVLEGSVRRDQDRIRVTAQLLDTRTGGHLWAETYDRDLTADGVFGVQDDIQSRVVSTIASGHGVISRAGQARARKKGTDDLNAYDCVLRSYEYERLHTAEAHLRARTCLERAVELDPTYVDALAQLAYLYREEYQHGFNTRPGSLDRALKLARHAIQLDPTNQQAHYALAFAHFGRREYDEFATAAERAIAINPNNARVVGGMGVNLAFAGRWERGVELARKAMALNPASPWWLHLPLSLDHYRKGEYSQALEEAQKISVRTIPLVHVCLAATYARLGRIDEARAALSDLIRMDPNFPDSPEKELRRFLASEDLVADLLEGLQRAGLEPQMSSRM